KWVPDNVEVYARVACQPVGDGSLWMHRQMGYVSIAERHKDKLKLVPPLPGAGYIRFERSQRLRGLVGCTHCYHEGHHKKICPHARLPPVCGYCLREKKADHDCGGKQVVHCRICQAARDHVPAACPY